MLERIGRVLSLTLEIIGFEEKETQGEKKDESVRGRTEKEFLQDGPDFPTGAASNALRSSSSGEQVAEEKAGSDDQKDFDGNALYQLSGWHHRDSSEGEAQKNIRENCQIKESTGTDLDSD